MLVVVVMLAVPMIMAMVMIAVSMIMAVAVLTVSMIMVVAVTVMVVLVVTAVVMAAVVLMSNFFHQSMSQVLAPFHGRENLSPGKLVPGGGKDLSLIHI